MQNNSYPEWLSFNQIDGLRDIDIAFGRFLFDQGLTDEIALFISAITSYQLINGNPCLSIKDLLARPSQYLPPAYFAEQTDSVHVPDLSRLSLNLIQEKLLNTNFVGLQDGAEPLALIGNNLYLRRYWLAAENIVKNINQRSNFSLPYLEQVSYLRELLDMVFKDDSSKQAELNWQKMACAVALVRQFAIITGGPGTGKTTTVVNLLSIFQAMAIDAGKPNGLRISLAAPTGKAAARLNESIGNALQGLAFAKGSVLDQALSLVPNTVVTLHKLLGVRANSRLFKHNADNPLDIDVLVIDEASMMDIEMFDAVLRALPDDARLILLGDKDQLASVEAGAIMGELCARSEQGHYNDVDLLQSLTGQEIPNKYLDESGNKLDQSIVMLRKSYRFHANSGIGKLAAAINKSDSSAVKNLFNVTLADLNFINANNYNWFDFLFADDAYPALFNSIKNNCPNAHDGQDAWDKYALQILKQQEKLQILCAIHHSNWGTAAINKLVENQLKLAGYIGNDQIWYQGRPIMVLRNRPDLGLANGDIGVALKVPDLLKPTQQLIKIAFVNSATGGVLWVSPARLDQIETVYALTIHKSQGSEFDHAVIILPDTFSPIMTKELLYTAVTRAKNKLSIVSPSSFKILEQAVKNPIRRSKALILSN